MRWYERSQIFGIMMELYEDLEYSLDELTDSILKAALTSGVLRF
jgi:hypothetical protein